MAKRAKAAKPVAAVPGVAAGAAAPAHRAAVRMYRQGLGDCLLITMPRGGMAPFRIMIDCGLVLGMPGATDKMREVMAHVVTTLDGAPLDMLVVTHPHWDHVSGFNQASDDFAKIAVNDVWMGWTEDASDDLARKLSSVMQNAETQLRSAVARLTAFGATRDAEQAASLLGFLGAAKGSGGGTTRDAVEAARRKAATPHYCKPGEPPFEIPGANARIYVLGPPRDEAELRQMDPTTRNPETYSMTALNGLFGMGDALAGDGSGDPFTANAAIPWDEALAMPFFQTHYTAVDSAWRRIDSEWLNDTTSFALLLDRAVNNSSLALAIELDGGEVLLFAADAQVGNWLSWLTLEWDVDGRKVTGPDLIARSTIYKVGHHASLNASLRAEGVEKMDVLDFALVPVDAKAAFDRKWGNNIPFPALLAALGGKARKAVLRSDQDWTGAPDGLTSDPLFYEVFV
jgi:hypothetical protein